MKLNNQIAFVTGAARGLGAGVAAAFAKAGCQVIASDILENELVQNEKLWHERQLSIETAILDASDLDEMENLVKQIVTRHGQLNIFVHCAAIMPRQTFANTPAALWQKEIGVNFAGFLNGVHTIWPHMVKQGGGHLIGVASGASIRGYWDEAVYCASKHALEGFAKSLAFEAQSHNIAINTMGPGKLIKPTGLSPAEARLQPADEQANWVDPELLGDAFVWLAAQKPKKFNGLRFDAGPIVDTIATEGFDFDFQPAKTTLYVADMVARQAWWAQNHS